MNKLIYVFDALCSWCYAFHPQLKMVLQEYPDFDLQMVNGGMFRGQNRRSALDMIDPNQVQEMYRPLREHGQAEISDKYMKELVVGKNYYLDSERPARGICQFRDQRSDTRKQLEFVYLLQRGMYVDGIDPNSDEYFSSVLPKFDIDSDSFLSEVDDFKFQNEAQGDFRLAAEYGVDSYPQLIYQTDADTYYLIAKGFTPSEDIKNRIQVIQQEIKE